MAATQSARKRLFLPPPPHALTLLSALLIVASFPPWDLTFLIWVALVPWLWVISRERSFARAAMQGIWLSFFMSLGGFYWVSWVLHEFAQAPWPFAVIGLLIFSLFGQLQFPFFAIVYRHFRNPEHPLRRSPFKSMALGLALSATYVGIDWALPKLFMDTLGNAFINSPILRQCADLGGAYLLSFLVLVWNDALLSLWQRLKSRTEPSTWPSFSESAPALALSFVLMAAALSYGYFRGKWVRDHIAASPHFAQAAAIQANIGDFDKVAAEKGLRGAGEKVLNTYFQLSDQALSVSTRPDFLVWPETAYPSTFRTPGTADDLARDQRVENYVRERQIPLLFGGYDRAKGRDFNALFALAPRADTGVAAGSDLQVYRKNVLLLFGEFIPGAEQFKWIRDAFPQVGNFGRGIGPEVVTVSAREAPSGQIKAGPVICYEALFPDYVIGATRKGSQLILNITNDSWFGPYGEPILHQALVAYRSIETRLPQLRSTNTGISSLILPDGEITHPTSINEAEILSARIPVYPPIWTLMKAWGDWFGWTALLAGSISLLLMLVRERSDFVSRANS